MRELGKFGAIGDVWLARNPPGFAFVEFEKAADAEKAVRALDGITVCDSRLRVEFAHAKPRPGGGVPRAPDTRRPAISDSRNGRSSSQRRYSSPRRRTKSPPRNGHLDPPRYPYGQLASLYTPDVASAAAAAAAAAGFPYQIPGYPPMFPFIPPEEILRGLQGHRRRSPVLHRDASPDYRRRSRSPVDRTASRNRGGRESFPYDVYDRRDYSRGGRSQPRGRVSPVRRGVSPSDRRHDVDRPRSSRDDRRRR
ncbi:hypothetical protein AAHC03_019302 [Spirometra sp. Aus1]